MADLSEDELLALREQFAGRITYFHEAHCEFTGKPPVLIPTSVAK